MYQIFDLETTIHQKYKRKASPFIPENWVVAEGWKMEGDAECSWRYFDDEAASKKDFMRIPVEVDLLVGFNIKFDMLWEMSRKNPDLEAFLKRGGKIWCCQYAEYLLRAQHIRWQMCSLNDCAIAHGGTTKIDIIKELWNDGVNTPDIAKDLLIDYLVGTEKEGRNGGDIGNTELVYLAQRARANKLDMNQMLQDRMDGLLATTFMEYYGLKIDVPFAKEYLAEQKAALAAATAELETYIPELPPELTFNWQSPIHKSALIFGGSVKYTKQVRYIDDKTGKYARKWVVEKWPLFQGEAIEPKVWDCMDGSKQDRYISGKRMGELKYKNVRVQGPHKVRFEDQSFTFPGYTQPDPKWRGALLDAAGKPTYSTDSDTIDVLTKRGGIGFLRALGRFTELNKEIGTYLVQRDKKTGELRGMLTCVDPDTHIIHHKLNHTNTVTTRLSSSDPNLQNLTRGDYNAKTDTWKSKVKHLFVSRFDDGRMVEADYSQLEVVVQGVLTGDKQLCIDLNNKIDFHCKRVAAARDVTYEDALVWCKDDSHPKHPEWTVYRTGAKTFSFQRAYGAGATTIANETGMTKEAVETMIAAEIKMYPGVENYYADVQKEIEQSAEPIKAQRDNGSWGVYRRGEYIAPTGTRYSWRSYDAPAFMKKRGIVDSFSPPEIRNYPVQGTGGEFVQCVLGLLIRHFISVDFYGGGMYRPSALLCNTVHDCVWADCKDEALSRAVASDIKPIMESIPTYYNEHHGMDITVPFPVDVEMGMHMNALGHL